MDLTDSSPSLLELKFQIFKFEFAFIKYSKVDVSKKLISFCFSSRLETALKFSANAIVLFTVRCRPSRFRCDSLLSSCKITLCSSLFKIFMQSFSTLAVPLLSKSKTREEIKMFLQSGWWVFISSLIFFYFHVDDVFVTTRSIICPSMHENIIGLLIKVLYYVEHKIICF